MDIDRVSADLAKLFLDGNKRDVRNKLYAMMVPHALAVATRMTIILMYDDLNAPDGQDWKENADAFVEMLDGKQGNIS